MTPAEQQRLTAVGPGTAMGELYRRYWLPVLASVELPAGSTRAVRVLGEDLVAYRTTGNELGLVAERCPHRGTSLRLGIVDGEGIRCPYHGWKFDRAGQCLAMPAEADSVRLTPHVRTTAYGISELGGLIFAYLGPVPAPLLPRYDLYVWDNVLRDIGRALLPCNWLQIMENSVDPTHTEWLHGHHLAAMRAPEQANATAAYARHQVRIGFERFRYGITKRRQLEGGSEHDEDWRVGHPLIFPNMLRVGAQCQHRFQIRVPVDDTHTLHWWYSVYRPAPGRSAPRQDTVPVYEVPWRDQAGNFIVDYVDGGDMMAWVSQGAIADRTRETLVSSDRGLLMLRQLYSEALEQLGAGRDPMGVIRDPDENRLIAFTQEQDKLGGGRRFLEQALSITHVRYSPLREQIRALLDFD
ncbi:MAG: Rieske 2Fe-2S domain-containing protein [Steroidobacteraceae bacterium]